MRLLATGDLQIGSGMTLTEDRIAEQARMWEWIIGKAVEHEVDAILVAGDVWHRYPPTPAELLAFKQPIWDRRMDEVRVIAIPGNHDSGGADRPTGLDVLAGRGFDRLDRPGWRKVGDGAVAALPWTPISRLVAEGALEDRDEAHAEAAELLMVAARGLREQVREGGVTGPTVLMAHWSVEGAVFPNGRDVTEFIREPVLPIGELADAGFDAVVLSHIHHAQMLHKAKPTIFYTGTPWVNDWSEADDTHDIWILDSLEDGNVCAVPITVPDRRFFTVDVDEIDSQLEDWTDSVVRVRYTRTAEEARRIDDIELRRLFQGRGAHKVFVQPTILRADRARIEVDEDEIEPLAALELGLKALDVDESLHDDLRQLTADLMQAVPA